MIRRTFLKALCASPLGFLIPKAKYMRGEGLESPRGIWIPKGKALRLTTAGRHKSAFYVKKLDWLGNGTGGYQWWPCQETKVSNYDTNVQCTWNPVTEDTQYVIHIIYKDENFRWHFEII